jgi:Protein of unknown function (DUF2795)
VYRSNPRADAERVSQVLAGLAYPAAKWQILMYAENYGADAYTRAELWALPTGEYRDLGAVLTALCCDAPAAALPSRRASEVVRYPVPQPRSPLYGGRPIRTQPAPQVAGRVRPLR